MGKKNHLLVLLIVAGLFLTGCQSFLNSQSANKHFKLEEFRAAIVQAGQRVEEGFDVTQMLSEPQISGDQAIIQFSPPAYPEGITFTLGPLSGDNSSDSVGLNMMLDNKKDMPDGYLVMACVAMVMEMARPGSSHEDWGAIDNITRDGGETVIDGWTFKAGTHEGPQFYRITFSATAPAGR